MKNKIDTSRWKEFPYTDFFEMITNKKKLTNKDLSDHGNTPVYSSSTFANGFFGYTERLADYIITKENPMYLIFGDHTKSMFIVKENFSVMDNVKVFKTKIYNEYCLRFITTVWQKQIPNIGYARHWIIAKEIGIKLPIDNNGSPDWEYMEQYMKNIEKHVEESLKGLKSCSGEKNSIKSDLWGSFVIKDIFKIKRPKARSQSNYEEGEIPFVASGNYNNGVLKHLKPKENELLDKGNCITLSPVDGSAFYQKKDFLGRGGAGSSIILLYNKNLNENNGIFIATIIHRVCNKYGYNDMGNQDSLKKEVIKLPMDKSGNPDWDYMEQYIKQLLKKGKSKLQYLKLM